MKVLRCGRLINGCGTPPVSDMAITVEEGVIGAIEPGSSLAANDADIADLSDATVIPGFVDAHVHLLFGAAADHRTTRRAVEEASASDLALAGMNNAAECLIGGVTTVRDCGDRDFITLGIRDAIASDRVVGPRVLAAGPPLTTPGGHLSWCGLAVDSQDAILTAVRESSRRGVDLIKVIVSGGNMTDGSDRLGVQFRSDELATAVAEAHRLGLPVAAHALSTESIRLAHRAGADTIEHCTWLSRQGLPLVDRSLVASMVRSAVSVTITMSGIHRVMRPGLPAGDTRQLREALETSPTGTLMGDFAWAREMRSLGARICLASDAGVRFTSFREFYKTIECGMPALGAGICEAIAMVTLRAAEAVGVAEDVGSIEVGKSADFVVLDQLIEESAEHLGPIREVWRNGKVVAHRGVLVDRRAPKPRT
jgi:imidazolonepropionase-like amidohydrolase